MEHTGKFLDVPAHEDDEVEKPQAKAIQLFVDAESAKELIPLLVKNGYHVLASTDGISSQYLLEIVHPEYENLYFEVVGI
jgi:hypothetical protein